MPHPRSRFPLEKSGDFPLLVGPWTSWFTPHHPNAHKLSDHEKCNVECLNQAFLHQNADIDKLGHLFELHQGTDAHDVTEQAMATVLNTLQCIDIAHVIYKCQVNADDETRVYKRDYGQLVPKPYGHVQDRLTRRKCHQVHQD